MKRLATPKYGFKSEFNPDRYRSTYGMMGAVTHPTGPVYPSDRNNFTPRLGIAYNFRPEVGFPRIIRHVHGR